MSKTLKKAIGILAGLAAFWILAASPILAQENPKPKKKSEQPYDYKKSKYKAYRALTGKERTYRFDSQGRPIPPSKSSRKTKARPVPAAPTAQVPASSQQEQPAPPTPQPDTETKSMPEAPTEQQ